MMCLWQHLLVGSRWAQIAGSLCWIIAGGGDVLVVATRIGGAAEREREREWNANRIKTQLRLIMPMMTMMMTMMMLLLMFDAWCGDKLTPDARTTTLCGGGLPVPPFSHFIRGWTPTAVSFLRFCFSLHHTPCLLTDSIWRADTFSLFLVSGLTQFASKTLKKFHLVLCLLWGFSSVFSVFFFPVLAVILCATVMKRVK